MGVEGHYGQCWAPGRMCSEDDIGYCCQTEPDGLCLMEMSSGLSPDCTEQPPTMTSQDHHYCHSPLPRYITCHPPVKLDLKGKENIFLI